MANGMAEDLSMASPASRPPVVPRRALVWLVLGLPHVCMHAVRQGLPLIIAFIAAEGGHTTAQQAFLIGAFYPGANRPPPTAHRHCHRPRCHHASSCRLTGAPCRLHRCHAARRLRSPATRAEARP